MVFLRRYTFISLKDTQKSQRCQSTKSTQHSAQLLNDEYHCNEKLLKLMYYFSINGCLSFCLSLLFIWKQCNTTYDGMTNIRKRLCLFFMLFAYVQTFSQSMRNEMRQEVPGISDPVTFETFSVWTSDSIAARVQILYRINGDFLFFSKNANAVKEEYIAQAEVVAEILDTLYNTVAREIQPVQIFPFFIADRN